MVSTGGAARAGDYAFAVYACGWNEFAFVRKAAFSIALLSWLHVKLLFYEKIHLFYPLFRPHIRGAGPDADTKSAGSASIH